jgi:outer membrane protein
MRIFLFFFYIIFFFNINVSANENIAYLDIDYLIKNTIKGKKIISLLEIDNKNLSNKLLDQEKTIIELNNDINSKKNILSKTEIDNQVKKLNQLVSDFTENKKKISNEFELKKNKEILNFFNEIRPIIEEFMIKNSISIVLDKKNILLANKNQEITNDVLLLIDKNLSR